MSIRIDDDSSMDTNSFLALNRSDSCSRFPSNHLEVEKSTQRGLRGFKDGLTHFGLEGVVGEAKRPGLDRKGGFATTPGVCREAELVRLRSKNDRRPLVVFADDDVVEWEHGIHEKAKKSKITLCRSTPKTEHRTHPVRSSIGSGGGRQRPSVEAS